MSFLGNPGIDPRFLELERPKIFVVKTAILLKNLAIFETLWGGDPSRAAKIIPLVTHFVGHNSKFVSFF